MFEDRMGNFVVVDPNRPRPLGAPAAMKRPPTLFLATTEQEIEGALEEMLFMFERTVRVNSRHLNLVERVLEARDRHHGRTKERKAA